MKIESYLIFGLGFFVVLAAEAQEIFRFAEYSFDQRDTPDRAALLGNSVLLGDAPFAPGLPTTTTPGIIPGFPESSVGFNGALGLGQLTGLTNGARAVNLPNGNDGAAKRHGIEVWWSGDRGLPNLAGNDIVVYEAGSSIASVEGVMVRAHAVARSVSEDQRWTSWYYFPPVTFSLTLGIEGVFANPFDFSNFGLASNAVVDRIQIANLTQSDRISGAGVQVRPGVQVASGRVVFDGSPEALPDAGSFDPDRTFDASTYDPDPLYVAALHRVEVLLPVIVSILKQANSTVLGLETGPGQWRVESSDSLSSPIWQLMERFTSSAGGATTLSDTGQGGRSSPDQAATRFYRIRSE